jgi:hypothetical protein
VRARDDGNKVANDASITFNRQTKKKLMRVAWKTRLRPNQALGFGDMKHASHEGREVQGKIPRYTLAARAAQHAKFDAIKARCRVCKNDPHNASTHPGN